MVNDAVIANLRAAAEADHGLADPRSSERVPCPCELMVRWLHAPECPTRYEILDVGNGGFRIRHTLPVLEGMVGVAVKLLPTGEAINRCVRVVWVDRPVGHEPGEAGLEYI
ncbi:MAG: hypothetical protein KDA25_06500 [Phycisphaerales bacterium]|nr:hypothetical protein [Phycisphaerales bacterium]